MLTWIRKHWRGEYSLAFSFWFNVVAINLAFAMSTLKLSSINIDVADALNATRLYIVIVGAHLVIIFPWQFVGLWRAAKRHRQGGGVAAWGWLACTFLGLGMIGNVVNGVSHLPLISEMLKLAVGFDTEKSYTLRVLDDGNALALYGGIGFGAAQDVAALLDETPSIRVIHLNSGGGRVVAARQLYAVIKKAGLGTYTRWGCASACTVAYLAGTARTMHIGAQLGFHQYMVTQEPSLEVKPQHDIDRRIFIEAGVRGDFIERVFATPHEDLWLPGPDALLSAGVITAAPRPNDHINDEHNAWYVESAESVLNRNPILIALREADAVEFERYKQWIEWRFARGDRLSVISNDLRTLFSELFGRRVSAGADDAVIELGRVVLGELKVAAKKAPSYCEAFQGIAPAKGAERIEDALGAELIVAEQRAIAAVIASSFAHPRRNVADALARAQFVDGLHARRKSGEMASERISEQQTVCDELIFTLQEMLQQPSSFTAELLRYWLRFHTLDAIEAAP